MAASNTGLSVVDYSVGAVCEDQRNRHLYLVEVEGEPHPNAAETFASKVDKVLCSRNEDYSELRARGLALTAPVVNFVSSGGFLRWMKSRRGLGGQYKVPRIVTDASLFDDMRKAILSQSNEGQTHDG